MNQTNKENEWIEQHLGLKEIDLCTIRKQINNYKIKFMEMEEKQVTPRGSLLTSAGIIAGRMKVGRVISTSKKKMMAALSGISSQPMKCLINTHWYFDPANGNEWIHDEGATIIFHETTKRNFSKSLLANLKNARRTVPDTIAARTARALDSAFGKCVLNGDILQGLLMLILFLPGLVITKRKSQANTFPSCFRNKS